MITADELGRRIAAARKERGLILAQLGYRTGRNITALSHIENGENYPSVPTLLLICKALGKTPDEFLL